MVLAAVAQMCSRGDIFGNLMKCQSIIRRASELGAKMVFLPEASDFITRPELYHHLATTLEDNSFLEGIRSAARSHDCWVSVGIHERSTEDPKKCFNTSVIISGCGRIEQTYRKLHLFDIDLGRDTTCNESRFIAPGKSLPQPVLGTPIGSVGQLICYDIRFPEPALIYRQRGAEILAYPSAFTVRTGGAHWETLLRARAIETQCYVIGAAQVGTHIMDPQRVSWGHAMIVDPWGTVLAQVPDTIPPAEPSTSSEQEEKEECGTSFALADIDTNSLKTLRSSMPILNQRRNDVYPKLD